MIERLPTGGDCRDGEDIDKINELVDAVNMPATSSHPNLVRLVRTDTGLLLDLANLIEAIRIATGQQL